MSDPTDHRAGAASVTGARVPGGAGRRLHLFGAAHVDRSGRCAGAVRLGLSNPGRFVERPGGAAFNVACTVVALGGTAHLHGIAGEDEAAATLRAAAAARGVRLTLQDGHGAPTASYTAIHGPDGDLIVALADMGIYDRFDAATAWRGAGAGGAPVLVDANLPADAVAALVRRATGPVAAMTVSAAKAARLRPALGEIGTLFTNRAELGALTGMPEGSAMETLLDAFARLGGTDAVASDGGGDVWSRHGGTTARHPVPPVPHVVDATGAGDALTAGCLHALTGGCAMDAAVAFGIRLAGAVLAVEGPWHPALFDIAPPETRP